MTLFRLTLRPNRSIFKQLVFAAQEAFLSGEFRPGQTFPSVRELATKFKIHPNTAHKVVQHLIQERWLEVRPGIGTVVAKRPRARAGDKKQLLQQEVEHLVVEAKRVGLQLGELLAAIEKRWMALERPIDLRQPTRKAVFPALRPRGIKTREELGQWISGF